jgi:hypothetical protein
MDFPWNLIFLCIVVGKHVFSNVSVQDCLLHKYIPPVLEKTFALGGDFMIF